MEFMSSVKYKQMSGRAGRTGFDPKGESVIICSAKEKPKVQSDILHCPAQNIKSGLSYQELSKGILEVISSGLVTHLSELKDFLTQTLRHFLCTLDCCDRCTFSYTSNLLLFYKDNKPPPCELTKFWLYLNSNNTLECNEEQYTESCRNCLLQYAKQVVGYLLCMKLIAYNSSELRIIPTPIGKGAFAGCIQPVMAFGVFEELQEARKKGVRLDTDLQLLYLTTAVDDAVPTPKWDEMRRNYKKLPESGQAVAEEYGIDEDAIVQWQHSGVKLKELLSEANSKQKQRILNLPRFYIAMILNDLICERPLGKSVEKSVEQVYKGYSIKRGELQGLQNSAGMHAGMLATFCERTCMPDLALLFHRIADRLRLTAQHELLDVMRIPSLRPLK